MKTSRYTEAQIIAILRQAEGGVPVAQLCREHGMSDASFYKWRAKYGRMDASMVSQMKAIEGKPTPRAVWISQRLIGYRVSLWTHTKTPPAFKFCRFLTLAVAAVGRMRRRSGSLKKAIATA